MITCSEGCKPICDFCQHFEPKLAPEYLPKRVYVDGSGRCTLYGKETDAGDGQGCDGFHCFRVKGEKDG